MSEPWEWVRTRRAEREGAWGRAALHVGGKARAHACRRVRGRGALLSVWLMKPIRSGLNEGVSEGATIASKVVSWLGPQVSGTLTESAPALCLCLLCL